MKDRLGLLSIAVLSASWLLVGTSITRAELVGYWSADTAKGVGTALPNDQGNKALDGELVESTFTASGQGFSGKAGDYAISFPGADEDYAVLPATERTFDEITITAWVKGTQQGAWAGIVLSRDPVQAIGLDFHAFDGMVNYIWNDNSSATYGFISDLVIPDDEWTFVALTVASEAATLWMGPKGGSLESAMNEIEHVPQDNFTEWRLAEDDCCGTERNFAGLIDDVSIWDQALTESDLKKLHGGTSTPLNLFGGGTLGDFNNDTKLDAIDIDLLSTEVRAGTNNASFDVTKDGKVDVADRQLWVTGLRKTWFGDANMDGLFSSTDFVNVFQKGEYEDGVDNNSTWAEGDWDGDANFSSGDFVTAFQDGGYEAGVRPAVAAVPEPAALGMLCLGLGGLLSFSRRRR